jgi:hypothetical protein
MELYELGGYVPPGRVYICKMYMRDRKRKAKGTQPAGSAQRSSEAEAVDGP